MSHHLQVIVILDVVTLHYGNPSIDDHELGVKRPQHRSVVILHFHVDVRHLFRSGQFHSVCSVLLWRHDLVILDDLFDVPAVVHDLDDHSLLPFTSALRKLSDSIGDD